MTTVGRLQPCPPGRRPTFATAGQDRRRADFTVGTGGGRSGTTEKSLGWVIWTAPARRRVFASGSPGSKVCLSRGAVYGPSGRRGRRPPADVCRRTRPCGSGSCLRLASHHWRLVAVQQVELEYRTLCPWSCERQCQGALHQARGRVPTIARAILARLNVPQGAISLSDPAAAQDLAAPAVRKTWNRNSSWPAPA